MYGVSGSGIRLLPTLTWQHLEPYLFVHNSGVVKIFKTVSCEVLHSGDLQVGRHASFIKATNPHQVII